MIYLEVETIETYKKYGKGIYYIYLYYCNWFWIYLPLIFKHYITNRIIRYSDLVRIKSSYFDFVNGSYKAKIFDIWMEMVYHRETCEHTSDRRLKTWFTEDKAREPPLGFTTKVRLDKSSMDAITLLELNRWANITCNHIDMKGKSSAVYIDL